MSGGCDRQRSDEDEIIEAHDVRLRRDRDEALQKASKAIAALVAAREDLEKARADRDEARLDVERRAQDARDAAGRAGVAYAHLESILRGEREAHVRTRADREAAERRIQEASVRLDALAALLRTTALDRGRDVFAALAALERALRGVTPIAGPWGLAASGSIEDRLTAVEARIAKLEGGAPQPAIEAPGYVPASGCAECGNDPGALHGVDCSRSNESRARR